MALVSIVIPVYHNARSLPELLGRLGALAARHPDDAFEFILVDDGSRDDSFCVLAALAEGEPRLRALRLARNFGSTAAVLAGLEQAHGDAVAVLAADLQDPPELLHDMLERWQDGAEVVLAVRDGRDDPLQVRLLADGFYSLYRRLAQPEMPPHGFDFFLADRRIIDRLLAAAGSNEYLMGLLLWLGGKRAAVPYHRRARAAHHGRSMWTVVRRMKYAADAFVGFSVAPLRLATCAGIGLIAAAAVVASAAFLLALSIPTWALIGGCLLLVACGTQLVATGILGEYVWRALEEVRRRPRYLVDRSINTLDAERESGCDARGMTHARERRPA